MQVVFCVRHWYRNRNLGLGCFKGTILYLAYATPVSVRLAVVHVTFLIFNVAFQISCVEVEFWVSIFSPVLGEYVGRLGGVFLTILVLWFIWHKKTKL